MLHGKKNIWNVFKPYWKLMFLLVLFTLLGNALSLLLPILVSQGIDAAIAGEFYLAPMIIKFALVIAGILVFTSLQSFTKVFLSENVARKLRADLSEILTWQDYSVIERAGPARFLTNFTADVDAIKKFVGQAAGAIISAIITSVGACILLLIINWKLALWVIGVMPVITIVFLVMQNKIKSLYQKSRAVLDSLNKVIDENIKGAALIRILNAEQPEADKFLHVNTEAKRFGFSILRLYSRLIPLIPLTANLATLIVLVVGGRFVIDSGMSIGELSAFNSYIGLVLFPVLMISSMSGDIAEVSASYERIAEIQTPAHVEKKAGAEEFKDTLAVQSVYLAYSRKPVLNDISFTVKAGSRVAILGPTAAGKTQLMYVLSGLIKPDSGLISIDGVSIAGQSDLLSSLMGFVFQDSIIFNMSIRENIAFSDSVDDTALEKAIQTAELKNFIQTLPDKLNTIVSERGSRLSGGQKQRIMLARALAINPKIILLDDFISRVDHKTGRKILENIEKNYPELTLIFVTQKIDQVKHYDKIIVLMQGKIIAQGHHRELLHNSPDYLQLYQSQQSACNYELQS